MKSNSRERLSNGEVSLDSLAQIYAVVEEKEIENEKVESLVKIIESHTSRSRTNVERPFLPWHGRHVTTKGRRSRDHALAR